MPGLEIIKRHRAYGGVLCLARVRAVLAVDQHGGLAAGNSLGIVVAARDAGGHPSLGELELVRLERRVKQKIDRLAKDAVEVLLEASPTQRGGGPATAGLNAGCLLRELGVERVARLRGAAAGAPRLAVHRDQANLRSRRFAVSATNQNGSIDERKLMVFLQENDEAIRELDAAGLDRLERVQWRDGNLLPRLGLWRSLRGSCGGGLRGGLFGRCGLGQREMSPGRKQRACDDEHEALAGYLSWHPHPC